MFDAADPYWSKTHHDLIKFFGLALDYVKKSGGDKKSAHWRKAERI